eukprot:789353-Amorphochlora_amoeboformis.AAC.1
MWSFFLSKSQVCNTVADAVRVLSLTREGERGDRKRAVDRKTVTAREIEPDRKSETDRNRLGEWDYEGEEKEESALTASDAENFSGVCTVSYTHLRAHETDQYH